MGWSHGTITGYSRGCRCDECREAHRDYNWTYERRFPGRRRATAHRRGVTKAAHGTRSRYVSGCRCDECRAADRRYNQKRARKKREGT